MAMIMSVSFATKYNPNDGQYKTDFQLYNPEIRPEIELNKHQRISDPKKIDFFLDCCESVYTGKNPVYCTAKNLNMVIISRIVFI